MKEFKHELYAREKILTNRETTVDDDQYFQS